MSTAEILAVLNTVERDHRLVLEKVQALKDTVSCLLEPGRRDPHRVINRLRELNEYFATEFASHLEEEETTLFPFLERYTPGGKDLVARLREEHADIQCKREELESCLGVATDLEGGPPRMVLRDLLTYGWELWKQLDNHAHVETREVHQCINRFLLSDVIEGDPAASAAG
jgi:iron-sulfur cluster repair protein YtfE (RIC family)